MANETEILELKFDGNGINPDAVPPHEIAELIVGFEKALLGAVKQKTPEIDITTVLFTFHEIKNESLGLRFIPRPTNFSDTTLNVTEVVLAGFTLLSTCLNNGDFNKLDKTALNGLKTITKFSRKYSCAGSFRLNSEVVYSFNQNTDISFDKSRLVNDEITLYGRIIDSGGENPNVHLKVSEDQTIIFKSTEQIAKDLAARLYENVAVRGTAKFNPATLEIVDFKYSHIIDFIPGKTFEAIKKLRGITSGYWDKFGTDQEINNELLRE